MAARHDLSAPRGPHAEADLRLRDVAAEGAGPGGRTRDLTILEVINDNRPFLLDSTLAELANHGLTPLLVAHPIFGVERDAAGTLTRVVGETTADAQGAFRRESFLHIHLDRLDGAEARTRLTEGLTRVYTDVAVATDDGEAMRRAPRRDH